MIDKYKAQPIRLRCANFLNRKDLGKMKGNRTCNFAGPVFIRSYTLGTVKFVPSKTKVLLVFEVVPLK